MLYKKTSLCLSSLSATAGADATAYSLRIFSCKHAPQEKLYNMAKKTVSASSFFCLPWRFAKSLREEEEEARSLGYCVHTYNTVNFQPQKQEMLFEYRNKGRLLTSTNKSISVRIYREKGEDYQKTNRICKPTLATFLSTLLLYNY